MAKIDIAGLKIDALTKTQLLEQLRQRIKNGQKTWLTTPYSEFLHAGLLDPGLMQMLNQSDLAVPDGIGLFWARRYLSLRLTAKGYWTKIFQAVWQIKYSLAAVIFYPSWIKSGLPEKISGADLVWDLARLAEENNLSVYLLGGFGDTPKKAGEKLKEKNEKLKIAGWSNKNPDDPAVLEDIKNSRPDMLFVAYGPIKQERWIAANLPNLPVKLAIGLGGTFDYIAGRQPEPPRFLRAKGLEWLWRLFTQPKRVKRIWRATFGLASALCHYKVFMTYPIRDNAVSVIVNRDKKIFIAKKSPDHFKVDLFEQPYAEKVRNYWQLPQGGIDDKEDLASAAARETKEETGITNLTYLSISASTNSYVWANATRPFWANRHYLYKGQMQKIVYFKFNGADDSVKLPRGEEFCDYKWVGADELPEQVHSERRPLAEIVRRDLMEMIKKAII